VLSGIVVAAVIAVLVFGVLVVGGVTVWIADDGLSWTDWWSGAGDLFNTAGWALQTGWLLALYIALPVVVICAWREGQRVFDPPAWLLTEDEQLEAASELTADQITRALAHLKIGALSRALKDGERLEFIVPPREQGGGTYTQVRLPIGVRAAECLPSSRVELLAGNLGRHKHEVWPQRQKDTDARVLDLWVADKGTLDKPAPAWPLLGDGEFDVFRDRLAWGVTCAGSRCRSGCCRNTGSSAATASRARPRRCGCCCSASPSTPASSCASPT
jgi:S-DNA-T family DNA segregation ATPase FtsK/SpoIIIE